MLTLFCVLLIPHGVQSFQCYDDNTQYGVEVNKDGDIQIAGIFWTSDTTMDKRTGEHKVKYNPKRYGLSRSLAMAMVIDDSPPLIGNYTIGYHVADSCYDFWISRYQSIKMAQNNKTYGFLAPDYALYVAETVSIMTTNKIPSITWIDNEETLLDEVGRDFKEIEAEIEEELQEVIHDVTNRLSKEKYPYVSSLIDSAEGEGKVMINLLNELNVSYFHMWYRDFSEKTAQYMQARTTCGRFIKMTTEDFDDYPNTPFGYNKYHTMETGVKEGDIHIVQLNSIGKTVTFLNHIKTKTSWRNKLYIIGFSSGRDSFLSQIQDIFEDGQLGAFIAISHPLLNHDKTPFMDKIKAMTPNAKYPLFNRYWELLHTCDLDTPNSTCDRTLTLSQGKYPVKLSSWVTFTALGTKILIKAINETLKEYLSRDPSYKLGECKWDFNRDVKGFIDNHPVHDMTIFGTNIKNVQFNNGTLDTQYGLKLYDPRVNKSMCQLIGAVSQIKIISLNKTKLRSVDLKCSQKCISGYRKIVVSSTYACCWSCELCSEHHISKSTNSELCIECAFNETSDSNRLMCQPVLIEYLSIDSMVSRFAICLVILLNAATVTLLIIVVIKRERPILKASNIYFCYSFITGNQLLAIASIFTITKPSSLICAMEYLFLSVSLSLITSTLTLRCFRIYLLFSATEVVIKPRCTFMYSLSGQIVIYVTFAVSTLCVSGYLIAVHNVWYMFATQNVKHESSHLICTASSWMNTVPFIIPFLFFGVTLFVSFKMRDYPHNFRETKSIFVATVIILISVATFCTGYSLASPAMKAFTRCIIMVVSSLSLLVCMFVPKFRILFFKKLDIAEERKKIKESVSTFTSRTMGMTISTVAPPQCRVTNVTLTDISDANGDSDHGCVKNKIVSFPAAQEDQCESMKSQPMYVVKPMFVAKPISGFVRPGSTKKGHQLQNTGPNSNTGQASGSV